MKKNKKGIILNILIGLCYVLSYSIICLANFMIMIFGDIDVDSILFTLMNPLKGANTDIVAKGFEYCLPRIFLFIVLYCIIVIFINKKKHNLYFCAKSNKTNKTYSINLSKIAKKIMAIGCIFIFAVSIYYSNRHYDFLGYFIDKYSESSIYNDYYVNPNNANIVLNTDDGEKKNIILIVMESMETTYSSVENGGYQPVSYIPNLDRLAEENISFSNSEKLGGFKNTYGSTWTISALLGLTSGVNYQFPIDQNDMSKRTEFAENLTVMGDVLENFGYNQMFLCGSDAEFGGRANYFKTHGNYKISDYYSAIEDGYIDEDYHVWWGYEDAKLYKIAKDKLINLASQDEPFNLTMLTVDTHFLSGYHCDLCGSEYAEDAANVVSCADKQLSEFIDWCKKQDFYEDTVIVISGDHERMDTCLIKNEYDRRIYNCFINSQIQDKTNIKNRTFSTLDMFPTIIAAMGFSWDGNRLGLGTNLFSNEQTLAEKMGLNNFNKELKRKSPYYIENFF